MGPEPTIKTVFIELSFGIFQKNINCANLQQFCGFSVIYIRQKRPKMAAIKVGAKAPAIKGVDQNGETIQLSDFKGQKVVLYFYPKDDTPGCTAQACNLRDNYKKLLKKGLQVLGVSVDLISSRRLVSSGVRIRFGARGVLNTQCRECSLLHCIHDIKSK